MWHKGFILSGKGNLCSSAVQSSKWKEGHGRKGVGGRKAAIHKECNTVLPPCLIMMLPYIHRKKDTQGGLKVWVNLFLWKPDQTHTLVTFPSEYLHYIDILKMRFNCGSFTKPLAPFSGPLHGLESLHLNFVHSFCSKAHFVCKLEN